MNKFEIYFNKKYTHYNNQRSIFILNANLWFGCNKFTKQFIRLPETDKFLNQQLKHNHFKNIIKFEE